MAKTLLALGAAIAIGAAAFTQSSPASAQPWVAPVVAGSVIAGGIVGAAVASSPCCGGYYTAGVACCGGAPRGLFTSGFGGGCGWQPYGYPAYGPAPYYTQPGLPYVRPYYYHRFTHPYMRPYYWHYYRPYARHDYHRYGNRPYHHAHHRHW